MKILMIAPEPFFEPRGTPFSVFHRTKALSKMGHEVDILTYQVGKNVNIPNTNIYRNWKVPFIKEIKIGPSSKKFVLDFVLFFQGFSLLKKGNYDCIHVHEEAGLLGICYKNIFHIPMIYDMHSSIPEQMINFKFSNDPFTLKMASLMERRIVNSADAVIGICPNLIKTVHSIDEQKKAVVIENTPMVEDLKNVSEKEQEKLRSELGLKNEKIVLYTGTFEVYQGIDLLIDSISYVVKKHPEVKFVFVGGEKEQIKGFEEIVKLKNIQKDVIFSGQRPFSEMSKFMAIADILVSPRSIGTNTPLKIYSYLKSGKPIVATNLLTHTQILNDDVAVLTDPTPLAYAEGIVKLLDDPDLGKQLGENGVKLMNENYTYEKYFKKTKEIYEYIQGLTGG
jgi:glycosyltransferase involved in cell wall biosynthesis